MQRSSFYRSTGEHSLSFGFRFFSVLGRQYFFCDMSTASRKLHFGDLIAAQVRLD